MSHLILIFTVSLLVFEFSIGYRVGKIFFTFADLNFVISFTGVLRVIIPAGIHIVSSTIYMS